jgi:hypothetical protein
MQGPRQGLLSDVSETSGRRRGLPSQRTEAQMNKTKPKDCGEAQTETGEAVKGPKPHNLSEEKQVLSKGSAGEERTCARRRSLGRRRWQTTKLTPRAREAGRDRWAMNTKAKHESARSPAKAWSVGRPRPGRPRAATGEPHRRRSI